MDDLIKYSDFEEKALPNATAVLVLGIISIVTCCCYGIIGLPCGIIAVVLANKDSKLYHSNPQRYTGYSNVNAGKILGIIGIVLNVIFIAYIIWIISFIGWEALQDPELLQDRINELQ